MEDNAVRASIPKGKYNTPAQFTMRVAEKAKVSDGSKGLYPF
jgi:hypothetical protein